MLADEVPTQDRFLTHQMMVIVISDADDSLPVAEYASSRVSRNAMVSRTSANAAAELSPRSEGLVTVAVMAVTSTMVVVVCGLDVQMIAVTVNRRRMIVVVTP